ncbi:hypothetical protein LEP1GSC162_3003 [Leptospira santarosai str. CBC1531]|nr:hypothetical protein LEP1GSC162_3003 [Leptospira santarosai str. CBC1531]
MRLRKNECRTHVSFEFVAKSRLFRVSQSLNFLIHVQKEFDRDLL